MRAGIAVLHLLPTLLVARQAPPRFMYIYRDSLKAGVDSAYRVIENDAAQVCADLKCPNPYVALESLSEAHEVWWLNTFATEADTARVASVYAAPGPLTDALGATQRRKASLIGTPIQGFAVYRPELSRGAAWTLTGERFVVVTITRVRQPAEGSVWETADSTLYIFRPSRTRPQANARIFAVRPNWSMPAPEWVAADPDFWAQAPVAKTRR